MGRKQPYRSVAVIGAGMSKFGVFEGTSSRDLFADAYLEMLSSVDRGFTPKDIDAVYIGNFANELFENQGHVAPLLSDWSGLVPAEATRIENACASGGAAIHQGFIAVASGLYDLVLVGGVEKMTNLPTERITDVLGIAADTLFEIPTGFTFPGFYAAMAVAYLNCYGASTNTLKKVAIKNHENGALNDKAQFNMTIRNIMDNKIAGAKAKNRPIPTWCDEMDFLNDDKANPWIAWPLRLYDCSPITDGAACILLAGGELAHSFTSSPIFITGTGQASDYEMNNRTIFTSLQSARIASQKAYDMAGISPADVDFAEVHDCFSIAEIIATEDLGFFKPGQGHIAIEEGITSLTGDKPINPSGGLKAKGHPIGASGVGQAVEVWQQLRGCAGARQVNNARCALTHNVGGTGQTCVVNIYERK
jgi:acetyl-CoA acetyltransferase